MSRKKLNPEQLKAVEHIEGPLLVFAGAGSGKTMVIVHRIARLLQNGVSPHNILAVTFTNKAAEEMRNRVKSLVGGAGMSVWISTFHSLAVRILREDSQEEFTIYDEHDQIVAIKEVLKKLDLDPKKVNPYKVKELISNAKNNLMDVESFLISASVHSSQGKYIMGEVYREYQKLLRKNGGYDFADLLLETVNLFRENPHALEKYRERFKYIMVDEYQDTNYAQYVLVKMLAPPQNNICVVGDDDQCLVRGTKIECAGKQVPVEKIAVGTAVKSGSGWGRTGIREVDRVSKRKYSGKVLRIKTKKGHEVTVTPNHMMFGRLKPAKGLYYVYLMYRQGLGYRIGVTQGVRSKRKSNNAVNGLMDSLNRKAADKVWILKTCTRQKEALYFEQFFAFTYGIPTYTFHSRGRGMALRQKEIDRLFGNIDTVQRAEKLMQSLDINELYPHLTACGDIINVRPGKKNTWRVETSRKYYSDAMDFIQKLSDSEELEIVKKSRLVSGKAYLYLPASHIHPQMLVPVHHNGKITEDTVISADREDYEGEVFDLSVPELKNYIAGGIVVHNSIYSWRGANVRNILDFEKHFKCNNILKLEENYRSTRHILNAAHNVIKNNISRKSKKLWTRKEGGEKVRWQEFMTNREEAVGVVSEIRRLITEEGYRPGDIAVFYRVNAQSRSFEDVLRSFGINYRIVGGVRFYERKEIKDILAYMKVLINNNDDLSLERIINYPRRGIGNKSVEDIKKAAVKESKSMYDLIMAGSDKLPDSIEKKLKPLRELFQKLENTLQDDDPARLAREVIELSGYHTMLEEDEDLQARSRLENIEELVSAFSEKENREKSVKEILNEILLLTDLDSWNEDEDYVTLMTVHLAKGLEFPAVFLTGLEEELFPHYDALNDPAQMEEERRLCYVGMTRAKELLYLTSASQRMLYGQSRWHIPSRFIRESFGASAASGGSDDYEYEYD